MLPIDASRPGVLTKISEKSVEGRSHNGIGKLSDEKADENGFRPSEHPVKTRSRVLSSSSTRGHASSLSTPNNLVENVELKGDKTFVVRTRSKQYTYIAEDAAQAARWVKEIEEVKSSPKQHAS
ncbi:hypothetical protein FRC03_010586 [Tulasnella sp. 419]|nr:hypothetical protein FRC03_010586 [Tulasnella sp. 419]